MTLHPKTLKEFMANKARSAERKAKRGERASWLWKPRQGSSCEAGRPKRAPSPYKLALEAADTVWSWLVRRRDAKNWGGLCRTCLKRPIQVAGHIIPRGFLATRLDPDNGLGMCVACNGGEQINRQRYQGMGGIFAGVIGEDKYADLVTRSRRKVKYSVADLKATTARLKSIIQTGAY